MILRKFKQMKEIRLKDLEKTFEEGVISKEEYERKKKEIEAMPEEKREESKEEVKEPKLKSDRILIIGAILLIVVFAGLFGLKYFNQEQPQTIGDLHELNFKGKLKPDQGFMYNDVYSFIKFDDFWYTKLVSQTGKTEFNFNFRFSPRELEDIDIKGNLDLDKFNNASQYYVTFDPLGKEFTHIRLGRLDFDIQMTKVFQKTPISACDRNVSNKTTSCFRVPIITCENTDDIVVYYKESDELSVEYNDNCIIISGRGFDIVKGVDRVLYNLYGIMEQ